jgi:Spy/CpxP family protein refolding chaperone
MSVRAWFVASAVALALLIPSSHSSADPFDPGPGRYYDHNVDANWQTVLDCTDDEWAVIEPRLDKVLALHAQGDDLLQHRWHALHHLLKHDARADLIQDALDEFRQARSDADLTVAQSEADLRQILTLRQEATLVVMGVLDP